MTNYDIMFFSAHPDDTEFAVGGTYLKLCKKYKVVQIILTRGEAGTFGTPKEREIESFNASKFAGADIEFMDFIDNHIDDNSENALKIASIIRKYKPKIVFAPYHTNNSSHTDGIAHPDHQATGKLVLKAARYAKFKNARAEGDTHLVSSVVYYMVPRYMRPTFLVDMSDIVDDLRRLWSYHQTQQSIKEGKIQEVLLSIRKFYGDMLNISYAEPFITDAPLRMDLNNILNI